MVKVAYKKKHNKSVRDDLSRPLVSYLTTYIFLRVGRLYVSIFKIRIILLFLYEKGKWF